MLSIQNSSQMNQTNVGFKAKKLPPKATQNLKGLYEQRAKYVKDYPQIMKDLNSKLDNGKISISEFLQQMDKHFAKLTDCLKYLGK